MAERQYLVALTAAEEGKPISPTVGRRTSLMFQNTGANQVLYRFGDPVRRDGSDFTLAAGQYSPNWNIADTTPNLSLNFYSLLGSTVAVYEKADY